MRAHERGHQSSFVLLTPGESPRERTSVLFRALRRHPIDELALADDGSDHDIGLDPIGCLADAAISPQRLRHQVGGLRQAIGVADHGDGPWHGNQSSAHCDATLRLLDRHADHESPVVDGDRFRTADTEVVQRVLQVERPEACRVHHQDHSGSMNRHQAFGRSESVGLIREHLARRSVAAGLECCLLLRQVGGLSLEGVVGAVLAVVHARLSGSGGGGSLTELLNPLMAMIVRPYLGAAAAERELERPLPAGRRARPKAAVDPLGGLDMRLTYRTLRVLATIAAAPGASNRQVAAEAGVADQGQISKLLARLENLGLIHNAGVGHLKGEPNAWELTARGREVEQAVRGESAVIVNHEEGAVQ